MRISILMPNRNPGMSMSEDKDGSRLVRCSRSPQAVGYPAVRSPLKIRIVLSLALSVLGLTPAVGQEQDATLQVFFMGGPYSYGNLVISPQTTSIPEQWRPHIGVGALWVPRGRNWGALVDLTTSTRSFHWKWDGDTHGAGPNDNFSRVRRISLVPSVVRLWRRETFSIYAGAGLGIEQDRERNRLRNIVSRDETGQPILADEFTESNIKGSHGVLAFRGGILVSLNARIGVRFGYSYLRRYFDHDPAQGIEVGIGYRF